MLSNPQNITAIFRDVATRHPDILHTEADKRFFELEWDEMIQNSASLGKTGWYLVLEDYVEHFKDNDHDYVSIVNPVSFMITKHVPMGKVGEKEAAYQEARRIAKSIVAKLRADELDPCNADLPDGVTAPRHVDLSSLQLVRVQPPMFQHHVGVRTTVKMRFDQEGVTFERDEVAWQPLS